MTLRLNGSTSGYVEIDAPAVAGSNTLTLPTGNGSSGQVLSTDGSGGLSFVDRMTAAGPAFRAQQNAAQSITTTTTTKIAFQNEIFDTNNCYDDTTNYRFTPTVAGYYQVNACVQQNTGSNVEHVIWVFKNGSNYQLMNINLPYAGRGVAGSALVYLNGSTDFIEIYFYSTTTANTVTGNTFFDAHLARPA